MNTKIHKTLDPVKKHILLASSFFIAATILSICSKSSPLYPMNDWVDVHCFLTLGKGLLNGLVPYVDLYEQKGPVLYFIYAIVAMFNQNSFMGQYLLEVVTFGLFLFYSGKIAQIYLGRSWLIYPILILLSVFIGTSRAFCHGGSVEQMCLFLFTYGLYTAIHALEEKRGLTFAEALTNGIFAGMAFWIKYTMVGAYMGLACFVLIWYTIQSMGWKKLLQTIGGFLAGFAAVSVPVLLYFLINGALDELFTCYFYNNLFLYPNQSSLSVIDRILDELFKNLKRNLNFLSMLALGASYLLIQAKERPLHATVVGLSFSGLCFTTFLGKSYWYYGLVLGAYTVFGLIAMVSIIRHIPFPKLFHLSDRNKKLLHIFMILVILHFGVILSYKKSSNTYLMSLERKDMPQYQFAETISKTHEDPTILNFGFLDGGFYYTTDTVPTCPFFCVFNVEAPGMWDTQFEYVREGKVDFLITRRYTLDRYPVDGSKYELIDTSSLFFEDSVYTYYLYKLK